MILNDKLNKAYLSILKEQSEDVCPECGKSPCECSGGAAVTICPGRNFQQLIEDFSSNVSSEGLIELLNIAVNDELLAAYNYLASYTLSKTEGKSDFDPEFMQHEKEEYEHAHMLIERLRELNANALVTPWCDISRCSSAGEEWTQEMEAESTAILLRRYQEEIAAVEFYSFILGYIKEISKGNESETDTTTHQLIKKIKADEEAHAKDLRDLLTEYGIEISEDLNPEAFRPSYSDEDEEEPDDDTDSFGDDEETPDEDEETPDEDEDKDDDAGSFGDEEEPDEDEDDEQG